MTTKRSQMLQLGIFWLIKSHLVVDSAPLGQAEAYGDHVTLAASHIEVWKRLQLEGRAPVESDYDEYPRGRIIYHPGRAEVTIMADRCILERPDVIARLKRVLNLSEPVKLESDLHYRCWRCLYKNHEGENDNNE